MRMQITKNKTNILSSIILSQGKEKNKALSDFNNVKMDSLDEIERIDLIEKLNRKMKKYAQNFQFEEAALLRDQIIKLSEKIKK